MLKKICVIGSSGFVGSHLVAYLHSKKIETVSETVSRPNSKKNIEDFYENYISKILKKNSKIDLFINCAGSISCKKYESQFLPIYI
jgi:NAD dependent epimerase/dehydratase family enzyme